MLLSVQIKIYVKDVHSRIIGIIVNLETIL